MQVVDVRPWITIDPGLRGCGCAVWSSTGNLQIAEYVIGSKAKDFHTIVKTMADSVEFWGPSDAIAIIELPQTYRGVAAKGDANDLIALGAIAGALSFIEGFDTRFVQPREWKGNIPKEVIRDRAIETLTVDELRMVQLPNAKSLQHNVWDAVGIGLWALKKHGVRK